MAVKYFCPKCGRRFVEWGAQKLEFKCPTETCDEEPLVLPGAVELEADEKPKVKRAKKAKSIVPLTNPEDDIAEMDDGFIDGDEDIDDDEEELEEEEELATPVVAADDDDGDGDDSIIDDGDDADADAEEDDTFVEALDLDDDGTIEEE